MDANSFYGNASQSTQKSGSPSMLAGPDAGKSPANDQSHTIVPDPNGLGEKLYGASVPKPSQYRYTETPLRGDESHEELLEHKVAKERALADAMFGDTIYAVNGAYGSVIADDLTRIKDIGRLSKEQVVEYVKEVAEFATQLAIPPAEFGPLHSQLTHMSEQILLGKVTPEMMYEHEMQALKEAREKWGAEEADERLEYAKQFARQMKLIDPAMLAAGLGNYPPVVLALMEYAPDAIKSGRVKIDERTRR
jgi:hypothetical protein